MLVVDGVEVIAVDEPHEVRELERRHAIRLQQSRETGDEVIDVRYVREHVVRDHQVSGLAGDGQSFGKVDAKELLDDVYASSTSGGCGARRRLDTQAGDA